MSACDPGQPCMHTRACHASCVRARAGLARGAPHSTGLGGRTLTNVGRCEAEHIMRVLTTSRGVVVAAAAAPALPPMMRSSRSVGCDGPVQSGSQSGR